MREKRGENWGERERSKENFLVTKKSGEEGRKGSGNQLEEMGVWDGGEEEKEESVDATKMREKGGSP